MTELRKAVMTVVEVSWEDSGGILQTLPARMENKSAGGACIRIKTPITVGSGLSVQWRVERFSGIVRYCRADDGEYLVGIQRDIMRDNRESPIPVLTVNVAGVEFSAIKVSKINTEGPLQREKSKLNEASTVEQKMVERKVESALIENVPVESVPIVSIVSTTTTLAPEVGHEIVAHEIDGVGREIENWDSPRSRSGDFDAFRQIEPEIEPQTELRIELRTEQLPKRAGKERKRMPSKWLELPWRKKQEGLSVIGPGNGEDSNDGNNDGISDGNGDDKSEKENFMSDLTQPTQKAPARFAREVPEFQVDLSPMEDIYRAAGIMNPRRGYSVNKVVEMLHSAHIRELSKEMKRAAVLMALDMAGTPIEQVQKDAKSRQDALDAHEAQQRKQVEAEWARKAEEIIQIQAELESIKAHYMARIGRNMEGIARERAIFASWLALKQQECDSMSEAVEVCSKAPASESASAPSADVSMVKVSAKTV